MDEFEVYLKRYCNGKRNAAKSPVLESVFHCTGSEIRKLVNDCRCRGVPVCSGPTGYYYSTEKTDINRTVANLAGRIEKIEAAVKGLLGTNQTDKRKET